MRRLMRCTGSWLPPRAGMSGSGRLPSGASNCRAGQAGGARGHRCDRAGAGALAAGLTSAPSWSSVTNGSASGACPSSPDRRTQSAHSGLLLLAGRWVGNVEIVTPRQGWLVMTDTIMPPVHPGEILLTEFLEPLGVGSYQLAKAVKVPARCINEIVRGQSRISADLAQRLGRLPRHRQVVGRRITGRGRRGEFA